MKIVHGRPPNFAEIAAALPEAWKPGAIFCYGDTVYTTGRGNLSAPLRAHEAVHAARQGGTEAEVQAWWRRYIAEPQFRYDEELPAHQAEFARFCELERDKELRHRFLVEVAQRLSGPLYGGLVDFRAAKAAIRATSARAARAGSSGPFAGCCSYWGVVQRQDTGL